MTTHACKSCGGAIAPSATICPWCARPRVPSPSAEVEAVRRAAELRREKTRAEAEAMRSASRPASASPRAASAANEPRSTMPAPLAAASAIAAPAARAAAAGATAAREAVRQLREAVARIIAVLRGGTPDYEVEGALAQAAIAASLLKELPPRDLVEAGVGEAIAEFLAFEAGPGPRGDRVRVIQDGLRAIARILALAPEPAPEPAARGALAGRAQVVDSQRIECPTPGCAVAIAKVWSCGCVDIPNPPKHRADCAVAGTYWTSQQRRCDQCPACHESSVAGAHAERPRAAPIASRSQSAAGVQWTPWVEPGRQIYPSWIVATATVRPPSYGAGDAANSGILGDPEGMFGVAVKGLLPRSKVRVTVESDRFVLPSSADVVVPHPREEWRVLPKVRFDYVALGRARQQMPLDVVIKAECDGRPIGAWTETCTLRSVNDCPMAVELAPGRVLDLSWMFAAYVNENHPWIDAVLLKAARKLSVFDGEQNRLPERVLSQSCAIWSVLRGLGMRYSDITRSAGSSRALASQHVRFLDETIANAQANCVDGSVLLASALRKIGLQPMLVLVPGHMYLAVQLSGEDECSLVGIETTVVGATAEELGADRTADPQILVACRGQRFDLRNLLGAVVREIRADPLALKSFERACVVGTSRLQREWSALRQHEPEYRLVSIADTRAWGLTPLPYLRDETPPAASRTTPTRT